MIQWIGSLQRSSFQCFITLRAVKNPNKDYPIGITNKATKFRWNRYPSWSNRNCRLFLNIEHTFSLHVFASCFGCLINHNAFLSVWKLNNMLSCLYHYQVSFSVLEYTLFSSHWQVYIWHVVSGRYELWTWPHQVTSKLNITWLNNLTDG